MFQLENNIKYYFYLFIMYLNCHLDEKLNLTK